MKKLICVILYMLAMVPLNAQYVMQWADTIDNGADDVAYDMVMDRNRNVYITGLSYIGNNNDYLTIKYDPDGNILWIDTLDLGGSEFGYRIAIDSYNNIYVLGNSNIILKYDSLGNLLDIDTLAGGNGYHDITADSGGNVYVTGVVDGVMYPDIFTAKYDTSGQIEWIDSIEVVGFADYGTAITVDANCNAYIIGDFSEDAGGALHYIIQAFDSTGQHTWLDMVWIGEYSRDIVCDNKGNIYITGMAPDGGCLVVKYDSMGSKLWVDTLGYISVHRISVDANNNIYLAGQLAADYIVTKYDSTRTIIWADTIDNGVSDVVYGLGIDVDENIYITGPSIINGDYDYFTLKYEKIIGVEDQVRPHIEEVNYYCLKTIFAGPLVLPKGKNCKVFDIMGRTVMPEKMKPGIYFIEVDGIVTQKVIKVK